MIQPSVPPAIAERQADRRSAPDYAAEPPAERRVDRQVRTVPPPVAESTSDLGGFQLRPTTTAGAAMPPPARQPHSRWEKPEPPKPLPAAPSRFAPPQTAAPAEPQAFDDADLDPFAEGGLFSEPAEAAESEDAFPLDGFGMVPGYGDDEGLPPYDDEDVAARGRSRRPSRNLIIVGAVVAIAIVGGVAVAMFRSGGASSGPPPTILADGGPTKITPADSASPATADADAQNKLIYDRVNSAEANTDTTLLTPDSGPIQNAGSTDANNAISRVILPGGPGFDAPAAGNATPAGQQPDAATPPATAPTAGVNVASNEAANTDAIEPIGPRKVRTVVVRPDGTILSSDATDATPPAAAAPAAAAPVTPQATPAPAAPITDDTAAIAGNGGNALAITTTPDVTSSGVTTNANTTVDAQATPATPPAAAVPAPAAVAVTVPATPKPAKAKPAPTVVAQADLNAPIDLTPGVPAGQAATAAADGVLVQISSQRSEDAARATYKDLQARYPNILGKYDVNLQRADVPDRGTFYRVRVGPFSASDAQRLCDDLKSAGGDCVLAKR